MYNAKIFMNCSLRHILGSLITFLDSIYLGMMKSCGHFSHLYFLNSIECLSQQINEWIGKRERDV